jgi:hypothetical protein
VTFTWAPDVLPRAVTLLGGGWGADVLRGGRGADVLHGQGGDDVLYGDAGDDDLYGEDGHDWLLGGTGIDGLLGDSGRVFTSVNGRSEPLHGITTPSSQVLFWSGDLRRWLVLAKAGALVKSADLQWRWGDGDDVLFGGLGDDYLHGGSWHDALSGAEALPWLYAALAGGTAGLDVGDLAALAAAYGGTLHRNFLLGFDPAEQDGGDVLFGGSGDDWLVGGRGGDHLYGGLGDDLLDADDQAACGCGRYPDEDPWPASGTSADIAFGGEGHDLVIAGSEDDRLVDSEDRDHFVVLFPHRGHVVVHAELELLLALAYTDGADLRPHWFFGELGMDEPHHSQHHGLDWSFLGWRAVPRNWEETWDARRWNDAASDWHDWLHGGHRSGDWVHWSQVRAGADYYGWYGERTAERWELWHDRLHDRAAWQPPVVHNLHHIFFPWWATFALVPHYGHAHLADVCLPTHHDHWHGHWMDRWDNGSGQGWGNDWEPRDEHDWRDRHDNSGRGTSGRR